MLTVTTTPSAPTVERIVDGEVVEVLLDLAPLAETILRDMARALTGRHDSDLADTIVAELLTSRASEWAHRSATAWQVALPLHIARRLADEIDEASVEPEACEVGSCDLLASVGHAYCVYHLEVVL